MLGLVAVPGGFLTDTFLNDRIELQNTLSRFCACNLDEQISRQKFSAHLLTLQPGPPPGRLPQPPLLLSKRTILGAHWSK